MNNLGKVKRKHSNEEVYFNKSLKHPLKQVAEILPKNYTKEIFLKEFKRLFPYQWNIIVERQQTYKEKAKHLYAVKKNKSRYNTKSPEAYFFSIPLVKNILSENHKKRHRELYNVSEINRKKVELEKKRDSKNQEIYARILQARKYAQFIDPEYLNIYIKAYHTKGISTEQKLIIVNELKKFDTEKVTRFFRKLNDAEQNDMIRNLAFQHLQYFGHYVKLRKKFKGKKKDYQTEEASLDSKKPEDLYQDLKRKSIQLNKKYHAFLSHSSKDQDLIFEAVKILNDKNKVCYCDWTMDNDYLKREFVSEYTEQVLKIRMEQSDTLIYLKTGNSISSPWVEFELEYFKTLKKPIYIINSLDELSNIENIMGDRQ